MATQNTVTLMEAITDIEFAVSEPYRNMGNAEGPKYRDLITSLSLIKVIVQETKSERAVAKVTKFRGGDYGTAIVENQLVKWIHGGCEPRPFKVHSLSSHILTFREEKGLSDIAIFGNIFEEMSSLPE